ncbi:MAG: hypothetical protein Q8O89_07545 [Nanoarchaeota archaeon]|nr:hypothetical protein [Nanoarchaeota archaeon]
MASADELDKKSCFRYNNEIVRVLKKEVVTVGTHSHSKLKFYVKNIFGGGEKPVVLAHNDRVDIVEIKQKNGLLLSRNGKEAQVMDNHSYETFDAEIIEAALDKVNENENIIFVEVDGKNFITDRANK